MAISLKRRKSPGDSFQRAFFLRRAIASRGAKPMECTRPSSVSQRSFSDANSASGRIGFAAYNVRTGILARTSAPILKSAQPMDVVLAVPDLRNATSIVIFNDGNVPAQVDVLDATVLTTELPRHQ